MSNTDKRGVPRASRRRTGAYRTLLALMALLTVLFLAACGSSDSDSGSSGSETAGSEGTSSSEGGGDSAVETARERLQAAMVEPKWEQPGPAFDAKKADGKKVLYIAVDAKIPVVENIYNAMSEGAKEGGVQVDLFDGKGQVSEFNRGMETAISQNYDAVVLMSISPKLVAGAVADADRAGVKVIEAINGDPGKVQLPTVAASGTSCYSCAGALMADYVIADSEGDAKGTIFVSEEVTSGEDELAGIENEFDELCPDCDFNIENVAIADWGKRLPTLTRSTLLSNPDAKYLMPLYDGMAITVVPAVEQANKPDVRVVSLNATPAVVEMMAQGDTMAADVGGAYTWLGWGLADQSLRVLSGQPPVDDENIPLRMFTEENLDEIDLDASEESWYGTTDFKSNYKKLWQVE
ncbi:MAG: sugar ABC transporter substrate-binding protein [Solirubrobacterales bacterium]